MGSILRSEKFWLVILLLGMAGGGYVTRQHWLPLLSGPAAGNKDAGSKDKAAKQDDHSGHGYASHDGGDDDSIELSEQAQRSIGLNPVVIELGSYERTMSVPGIVVERPGRSQVHINTPLTGIVTKIFPREGAAVTPGQPLFDLQLSHEDLVSAQRDFLRSAEELDVLNREIARLEAVGEGVIAGKRILERKYEQQKLKAAMKAQRQALLLHELNEQQVDEILSTRELLKGLTVRVPPFVHDEEQSRVEHLFHVQSLNVYPGQHIEAGQNLGVLADHCALYIEGQAFEEDARRLEEAIRKSETARAIVRMNDRETAEVEGLSILRMADQVDAQSRALRFYVLLPNEVVQSRNVGGQKYVSWRFRPGQRIDVLVPIERWENRVVLPVESVVKEGVESYVFRQNGNHFQRIPVHVEHRDQRKVVVANDGQLFPGDRVATAGAYRMQVALKNKSGGGVDPHAGHSH